MTLGDLLRATLDAARARDEAQARADEAKRRLGALRLRAARAMFRKGIREAVLDGHHFTTRVPLFDPEPVTLDWRRLGPATPSPDPDAVEVD